MIHTHNQSSKVQHCTRHCTRSARTPSSLLGEDLKCTQAHCTHTMQDARCDTCEQRATYYVLESSFIAHHDMMYQACSVGTKTTPNEVQCAGCGHVYYRMTENNLK